jgi:hypothetical protein
MDDLKILRTVGYTKSSVRQCPLPCFSSNNSSSIRNPNSENNEAKRVKVSL